MSTAEQHDISVEPEVNYSKICRVPGVFRRNQSPNEDCYNPLVVSIGPYHHKNGPNHELAEMQAVKKEMLEQFASRSGKTREVLYSTVAQLTSSARRSYDEGSTEHLDDSAFTEMMLLDGCFILQFISCFLSDSLRLNNRVLAYFVKRDLFLLENQLPYEVLTSLMSLELDHGEKGKKLMEEFMDRVRGLPRGTQMKNPPGQIPQPIHLLDLFHKRFMKEGVKPPDQNSDGQWCSYRSVMELKSVGIHFRPSKTDMYTDLQYKSTLRGGTVSLPRIVIDDFTKSLLLNLLAHETCPGSAEGFWVTSYVWFLDSLIDHSEDVKALRKSGILLNVLGSDQEVADLFNDISRFVGFNSNAYSDVKSSIEKHCKNVTKKWVAEWLHNHFSSPWTFLAFAGAVVALVLSFIQTYKTVYPGNDK
ncbi:hypothetical protein OIU76_010505 [Salix suchowensis]|nr:UPF0481 protein [Salix suchowensis]KAJ6332129.1 hypothetical protein OIU76_010505 [Salix suchowensis]